MFLHQSSQQSLLNTFNESIESLRATCKELDGTDRRLDHKFNEKVEKLDSRVDSVKEE